MVGTLAAVNYGTHDVSGAALATAINAVPAITGPGAVSGAGLYLISAGNGQIQVIGVTGT